MTSYHKLIFFVFWSYHTDLLFTFFFCTLIVGFRTFIGVKLIVMSQFYDSLNKNSWGTIGRKLRLEICNAFKGTILHQLFIQSDRTVYRWVFFEQIFCRYKSCLKCFFMILESFNATQKLFNQSWKLVQNGGKILA